MVIHLTKKLGDKLKTGTLPPCNAEANPFLSWYANVFIADRCQYIIVTNAASLYSVVMLGRGITDDNLFIRRFFQVLQEKLMADGMSNLYDEEIAPHTGNIVLAKTQSKSVLASMNDHIICSKIQVTYNGRSATELADIANRTPCGPIGYRYPLEAIVQLPRQGK